MLGSNTSINPLVYIFIYSIALQVTVSMVHDPLFKSNVFRAGRSLTMTCSPAKLRVHTDFVTKYRKIRLLRRRYDKWDEGMYTMAELDIDKLSTWDYLNTWGNYLSRTKWSVKLASSPEIYACNGDLIAEAYALKITAKKFRMVCEDSGRYMCQVIYYAHPFNISSTGQITPGRGIATVARVMVEHIQCIRNAGPKPIMEEDDKRGLYMLMIGMLLLWLVLAIFGTAVKICLDDGRRFSDIEMEIIYVERSKSAERLSRSQSKASVNNDVIRVNLSNSHVDLVGPDSGRKKSRSQVSLSASNQNVPRKSKSYQTTNPSDEIGDWGKGWSAAGASKSSTAIQKNASRTGVKEK